MPKTVHRKSDWLYQYSETGQTVKAYQIGGPQINWINTNTSVIYLMLIDDSIEYERAKQFKLYCEAYYTGCIVKLVRRGVSILDGQGNKKKIPPNFMAKHRIALRDTPSGYQVNASDVLQALKEYKGQDTFCILAITNQDLYPDEWSNFCRGLAEPESATAVFSFARHQVGFCGEESLESPEEENQVWMERSVHTMVHEIGLMFGLKHCIYYECDMNASNGHGDGADL